MRLLAIAFVGVFASVAAAAEPDRGIALPDGTRLDNVDFERHVAPLFTRLGCNAGSCHGAFEGQAGFKLSLFGQAPRLDFASVTDVGSGRVVAAAPDESLLLLKPSTQVEHEGGLRLPADSWEFAVVRRWISDGARAIEGSGRIARLAMEPAELPTMAPDASYRLIVFAEFVDGTRQAVTTWSGFHSLDESVAQVDPLGALTCIGPGSTQIVASYLGYFATLTIDVPFPAADLSSVEQPRSNNLVDDEIDKRLRLLNLDASPPADDAEFLRRASLDVLGSLPSVDEARAYLADTSPDKRDRLIDRLLSDPRRATWWATRMCDVTACDVNAMEGPEALRPKRAKMWHDWFRERFADNMPYDEIARGVLCATSRGGDSLDAWIDEAIVLEGAAAGGFESAYNKRPGLDLFWRRVGAEGPVPVEDLAELTAAAFMGLRLHCARCHQHPFDRWSQRDFAGYAAVFARTQFGSSSELRSAMNARLQQRREARQSGTVDLPPPPPRVQEVYTAAAPRPLVDAATAGDVVPQPPSGTPLAHDPHGNGDPRVAFFAWLTQADNPYFARNFVNRVWAKYFGRGLVEPVDAFSASNPPTHPRLLDRLADRFVRSGYDVRRLERLILSSAAYQRSWRTAGNNALDEKHYARWPVRPLPAEVLVDAVGAALETRTDFGADAPPGARAIELAPNKLADANTNELLRVLGRGDRKSLCECDRMTAPALRRPIFLMTQVRVSSAEGRLARLLREGADADAIVTDLYLAALGREPDESERAFARQHIAQASSPAAGLSDIFWAVLNTREFCTNH